MAEPRDSTGDARARAEPGEVDSLRRGLDVLRLFGAEHRRRGLDEIARELGLARPTAARLVRTLVHDGFLRPVDDGGAWATDAGCLALGNAWRAGFRTLRALRDALARTAFPTPLDVVACTLQDGELLCIEHVGDRVAAWPVGSRHLPWSSAVGRALMWRLPLPRQARLLDQARAAAGAERGPTPMPAIYRAFEQLEEHGYCVDPGASPPAVAVALQVAEQEAPLALAAIAPGPLEAERLAETGRRLKALAATLQR